MENKPKNPMPSKNRHEAKVNSGKFREQTSIKYWASEHKAILVAAVIGAIGTLGGAAITIFPQIIGSRDSSNYSEDYYLNYSFYNVLLDNFTPMLDAEIGQERSIVTVARIDSITKNRTTTSDYMLPFYTTGQRIEVDTLKSSVIPTFKEVNSPDEKYRHSYELVLKLGTKPLGDTEIMHTNFRFVDGFRNGDQEWWIASIKYPAKSIGVHIQCPKTKPCRKVNVYRRIGYGGKQEIVDNPAFLSKDGNHILWMGNDEKADTRIIFNWDW